MTNCSNNYGPYQYPEKLIPLMVSNALAGQPLPVYGQGDQVRDWLYVDNHARALHRVLAKGEPGETYNIGGHNEVSNIEVVGMLCDCLEELAPAAQNPALGGTVVHYRDLITHVADRPGHDRRYAIDAGKIGCELGWTPKEIFATGLRKTVEWYLQNPAWRRQGGEAPAQLANRKVAS